MTWVGGGLDDDELSYVSCRVVSCRTSRGEEVWGPRIDGAEFSTHDSEYYGATKGHVEEMCMRLTAGLGKGGREGMK